MPKLKKEKKNSEAPPEAVQEQNAQLSSEQAGGQPPEQPKEQPPKPPKESHLLLNVLTVLLVLLGIGEVGLLGYMGYQAFQGVRARQQYEAQQATVESERAQNTSSASYLGPRLQVENGVVVWRSEDSPLGGVGNSSTVSGLTAGGEEETRLANMSVPLIGYRLAREDEEQPA
ncbi:hypothetical protein D1646_16200 [Pseudoflavonifractor sp. 60]|uniref:hypothetical protein n=1 Tax=Pseudoflavonifractor sp. 60 TaxID=2304576 RepID=UPI00136D1D90|nr:hypothetical protein [Pseudoflavonifractor sp. 60]NBI68313.1 hypothetical protein [Pseudoflavonifractor sp. 60]